MPYLLFHCLFYYFEFFESEVNSVNEIKKSTFGTIVASESLWTQADSSPSHVVTGSTIFTRLFTTVVYIWFLCGTYFWRNCSDFCKCKIWICSTFCLFQLFFSEYTNGNETLEGLSVEGQTIYLSDSLRLVRVWGQGVPKWKKLNKSRRLLVDGWRWFQYGEGAQARARPRGLKWIRLNRSLMVP